MDSRLTPDRFTDEELKWSYWFINHRILLSKIIFGFLVFVNVILTGIFCYKVIDLYVLNGNSYSRGLETLVTTTGNVGNLQLQGESAVSDISILDTQTVPLPSGHTDLFALLGNANTKYYATFEYRFTTNQDTTSWKEGFLLPNETRYIHELFFESVGDMSTAVVEFRNITWQKFLEYEKFAQTHLQIEIQEPSFVLETIDDNGGVIGNKVTFTAKNNSSYNFRKVGFFVILNIGTQIQAVNHIVLQDVDANSAYNIEVPFYDVSTGAVTIQVFPEVNILDDSVYKAI